MSDEAKQKPAAGTIGLPQIEEFSTLLRTMFINVGFFAATLLLIPAVGAQFVRNAVVIEPVTVPEALEKQGFSSEVVANRLWDGLQAFAQSASAARESVVAIPDSQLIEFSLPDAGISIDSIFTQVRQFFGAYDTRIGGEIICETDTCAREGLRLRLRVVRNRSDIVDLPAMGDSVEADYYREAAAGVFAIIDPYVAIAAQAETSPLRAETLARRLVADGTKDAKWAHNLIGDIERRDGNPERAAGEYRAAIALDDNFEAARAGLALALFAAGDVEGARAALSELERRNPRNTFAPGILAEILLAEANVDGAIAQLRIAAERDPLNPEPLTRAGEVALDAQRNDEGIGLLNEALSIDPAHGRALTQLARAYILASDLASAEEVYRRRLEYEPDNVDAQISLANVQLGFKRYAESVASFDKALLLRPGDPELMKFRAGALLGLNRYPEAIESLLQVTDARPNDALAFSLLGRAYERTGRLAEAVAAHERVIAIAPDGVEATGSREAIERLKARLPPS